MIAHRLSTIRGADKIAVIADGRLVEFGAHDELMEKDDGQYRRLTESSKRRTTVDTKGLRKSQVSTVTEEGEDSKHDWEAEEKTQQEEAFNMKRARNLASPDTSYMLVGIVGAVMAGGVFPLWGVIFSETIDLLFVRVERCEEGSVPDNFATCEDYWQDTADDMRERSFLVAIFWGALFVICIVGNILTFWGFGMASERLNKRVRDDTFTSLLRQEVTFFGKFFHLDSIAIALVHVNSRWNILCEDKHSVGSLTSQLQDDAARLHAFSGEPVRAFVVACASVVTGVTLSFIVRATRNYEVGLMCGCI